MAGFNTGKGSERAHVAKPAMDGVQRRVFSHAQEGRLSEGASRRRGTCFRRRCQVEITPKAKASFLACKAPRKGGEAVRRKSLNVVYFLRGV